MKTKARWIERQRFDQHATVAIYAAAAIGIVLFDPWTSLFALSAQGAVAIFLDEIMS